MIDVLKTTSGRWRDSWISTYTFDLSAFEDHILNRMGEPPLEITILADRERLSTTWEDLRASGQLDRLRWIGRRYLVRSARAYLRFHPKTYLFGSKDRGILLVGSGNAGLQGLMSPGEVFSVFDSRSDVEARTIRQWRAWMASLVDESADPELAVRWSKFLQRCAAWLSGPASGGEFVENTHASLGAQLVAACGQVDELLLSAPFFDEKAAAVGRLVAELKPKKIQLWLGEDASVDGPGLVKVLRDSECELSLQRWAGGYVHAKLVGVIGMPTLMLTGSANLSLAGLWSTRANGNTEAGVLVRSEMAAVRGFFDTSPGPDFATTTVDLESLLSLTYQSNRALDEVAPPLVSVHSAVRREDGVLEVRADLPGELTEFAAKLATLDQGELDVELRGDEPLRTLVPVPVDARLVAVTLSGQIVSNWIVIDDESELRAAGAESSSSGSPLGGLSESDLQSEVGQLLAQLRSVCNFDYAWDYQRLARVARLQITSNEEGGNPEEDIDIESLGIHVRHLPRLGAAGITDQFAELEAALASVPALREVRIVGTPSGDSATGTGATWKEQTRLAVRLFNVLQRWCEALRLPEAMYDEYQETRNFAGLVTVLDVVQLDSRYVGLLGVDRVYRLVHVLFGGFVGSESAPGFFLQLPTDVQAGVVAELDKRGILEVAGDLVCRVINKEGPGVRDRLMQLRPWLTPSVEKGLLRGSDELTDSTLAWASNWMDDQLWADEASERYQVELAVLHGSVTGFGTELRIGELDLLDDPRAVCIAADYLRYSSDVGFTMVAGLGDWQPRLRVDLGERVAFMIKRRSTSERSSAESDAPVGRDDIYDLAKSGRAWASMFTGGSERVVALWRTRPGAQSDAGA